MSNDLGGNEKRTKLFTLLFVIPFILAATFIFVMSSFSITSVSDYGLPLDKVYHFSVFGILSYTLYRFMMYKCFKQGNAVAFSILLSSLYGLMDEIHQLYVPNRVFEMNDIYADILGSIFGVIIGLIIYKYDYRFIRKLAF